MPKAPDALSAYAPTTYVVAARPRKSQVLTPQQLTTTSKKHHKYLDAQ